MVSGSKNRAKLHEFRKGPNSSSTARGLEAAVDGAVVLAALAGEETAVDGDGVILASVAGLAAGAGALAGVAAGAREAALAGEEAALVGGEAAGDDEVAVAATGDRGGAGADFFWTANSACMLEHV